MNYELFVVLRHADKKKSLKKLPQKRLRLSESKSPAIAGLSASLSHLANSFDTLKVLRSNLW